jgi:integrase/recombinase XerD
MERSAKKLDALLLAFTAYMADRKPKPLSRETRYNYRGRVGRAIAEAQRGGHSLLADDVRTLRFVLGRFPPHPTTQTGYISAIQAFYDFLMVQGLRKDNPARQIGRPPMLKHAPRPLPEDACFRYEQAAIELGLVYETIAALGLYQGWRRSEIRLSQWSWFFAADGLLWADVVGKGAKVARVHVHDRTANLLPRLRGAHNDPVWLLPSPLRHGAAISGTWMSGAHHRICEVAGIPIETALHQLRHSYATYLRRAGADQAVVQLGLRHADPKSTAIYMQVFPDELARAHNGLRYRAAGEKEAP